MIEENGGKKDEEKDVEEVKGMEWVRKRGKV